MRHRLEFLGSLCFGLLVLPDQRAVAQQATLSGTLHVVWANDPRPGSGKGAELLYLLTDDTGKTRQLLIDASLLKSFGGPRALARHRVEVTGDTAAGVLRATDLTPNVEVRSIRPLQAIAPDAVAPLAVAGPRRYVTILCKFNDVSTVPNPASVYQAWNLSLTAPNLPNYWAEVSNGSVDLTGSVVVGWLALPASTTAYMSDIGLDLNRLIDDCTAAADPSVDFPSFDGINLQFNYGLVVPGFGGASLGGTASVYRDGQLKTYSMTWLSDWANLGVYAHEEGHGLGFPHSSGPYAYTYDSQWDVMSAAWEQHTIAYHKELVGWIPTPRTFIPPVGSSHTPIVLERQESPPATNYLSARIPIPSQPGMFYSIEVRKQQSYDQVIPGNAVIIYQVDPSRGDRDAQVVDADNNDNTNDAGAMWVPGEMFQDAANGIAVRVDSAASSGYGVTIDVGNATPIYTLNATLNGSGRVRELDQFGSAINCPSTCTGRYFEGAIVMLGATAAQGFGFTGWSGDCEASPYGNDICQVTMTRDKTATATFGAGALVSVAVAGQGLVWSSPGGIYCRGTAADCASSFPTGTAVFFGAGLDSVPPGATSGSGFAGWSGACSGLDTCWLTVNGPLQVSASFVPGPLIAETIVGLGTVSSSATSLYCNNTDQAGSKTCLRPGAPGVLQDVEAWPDFGWNFAGWGSLAAPTCFGYAPCFFTIPALGSNPTPLLATFVNGTALGLGRGVDTVSMLVGSGTKSDSVDVVINGNPSTQWSVAKQGSWLQLQTTNGTGPGLLHWTRNVAGLAAGTYVGQITVTGTGVATSPYTLTDSLFVLDPLTLAVSPRSRRDSLAAGASTPQVDSATVTLSGLGSGTAAWTATHRSAATWTTLTTGSGQGSGTLRWSRSAASLAPGLYIDTLRVTATGASGSPAGIIDSFVVLPTLTLTLSPTNRRDSLVTGSSTPKSDSATVTLSGIGSGSAAWTATHRNAATWNTLTTGSGQGNGTLRWSRSAAGLGTGVYVDTINVTAAGALGSPAHLIDSLIVLEPLTLAVVPVSRRDSLETGAASPQPDSATVMLSGIGSGNAAWSAAHRGAATWNTLTAASGQGNGKVRWTRNAASLTPGVYVDTISVSAAGAIGSPKIVIDSLVVFESLTLSLAPSSRRDSAFVGAGAPHVDSAAVVLTGFGASGTAWNASHGAASWLTLVTASGTGSGKLGWSRASSGLAVGTYVDTIVVTAGGAAGSPAHLVDSLSILPLPPDTVALARASGGDSVAQGQGGDLADSVGVTVTGPLSGSVAWTATHGSASWLQLTTAAGNGSGQVRWTRNSAGLSSGTYVDTLTVTAGAVGSPARYVDSLRILAPIALTLNPVSRRDSVPVGTVSRADSARVMLSGFGASGVGWSATHGGGAWLTLVAASGTGSGALRWTVNLSGLSAGLYVDTITVTAVATAGSPARIVDSLYAYEPAIAVACAGADFLTGSCLTVTEQSYLDQTGNQNGVYDVGDLLAYLDRKGLHLDSALLAALQRKDGSRP